MKISIIEGVNLLELLVMKIKAALATGEPIEVDDLGKKFEAVNLNIQNARGVDPAAPTE